MRLFAWMFALFNIAIGVVVGLQTQASHALRSAASWLAIAGVVLYPIRDTVNFWGRWLNPISSQSGRGQMPEPQRSAAQRSVVGGQ